MSNIMQFMGSNWAQGGMDQIGFAVAIAAAMVVLTTFQQFLLNHFRVYLERLIRKFVGSMDPYVQIKFHEEGGPKNYAAYAAIQIYLSTKCTAQAPRLKANVVRDIKSPVLCIDDGEGVSDEFKGVKVSWHLSEDHKAPTNILNQPKKIKYFVLTFRKRNREIIVGEYLKHVMEEGTAAEARNRQLKLYSNCSTDRGAYWNYTMDFQHPATFETIAMESEKKQDIIEDLIRFSGAREYYRTIGKPWKRGYLLYGPPGTGKSTMIAAMANLLSYDVYDLELTAVSSNGSLKLLLNRVPSNSILVIEDIDCSSKVTCHREKKKGEEEKMEKITLSGVLNSLDGLFSANDGGRVMVFTTNHVENLDSALVRRGRMDKHIEMSFCRFEGFEVLAKNYLGIEKHELFPKIRGLLKESNTTPADVAENLIINDSPDACLQNLVRVLEEKMEENIPSLVCGNDLLA